MSFHAYLPSDYFPLISQGLSKYDGITQSGGGIGQKMTIAEKGGVQQQMIDDGDGMKQSVKIKRKKSIMSNSWQENIITKLFYTSL